MSDQQKLLDAAGRGQSAAYAKSLLDPIMLDLERMYLTNMVSLYESGKSAEEILRIVGKLAAMRELNCMVDSLVIRGQKARRELDET